MKKRLDVLLIERKVFSSRNKAQHAIRRGEVTVEGEIVKVPGAKIPISAGIEVHRSGKEYPGRGGIKLEYALKSLEINPRGWKAFDGGASTGGFTSCLLQNGAEKVYAVDVGSGQLAEELRCDERVVVMENCNLRYFDPANVDEPLDLILLDLSFISATKVIKPLLPVLRDRGLLLILVKPQFEVGPEKVRKGLVKNHEDRLKAVEKVARAGKKLGLGYAGCVPSTIRGSAGNQEFFLLLKKGGGRDLETLSLRDVLSQFSRGCED